MYIAAKQLHILGIDVPIDFIFDEQGGAGDQAAASYGLIRATPPSELKALLGSHPIFRDDKKPLPLQATDMLAWHLRRSREKRFSGENRAALDLLRKDSHVETWIPDEMLHLWADKFSKMPGIENVKTKKQSTKKVMMAIDSELRKMPSEDQPYEKFDAVMGPDSFSLKGRAKASIGRGQSALGSFFPCPTAESPNWCLIFATIMPLLNVGDSRYANRSSYPQKQSQNYFSRFWPRNRMSSPKIT